MNINNIVELSSKPEIYSQGTAKMWVDEHISKQLLDVHLSQHTNLASRKLDTIKTTIDWITDKIPGENLSILDLGCGPGLYTEELASKGHKVTGMDFSASSIQYAKKSAIEKDLKINYLQQDYLTLAEEGKYDLVMMIFTDLGVLVPEERKKLLANVRRALKPGGVFLFDVLNKNALPALLTGKSWEASLGGFWREESYLSLSESFHYEKEDIILSQHLVVGLNESTEVYRFWIHTFGHKELQNLLTAEGFTESSCYEKVIADSELYSSNDVTFCIARL